MSAIIMPRQNERVNQVIKEVQIEFAKLETENTYLKQMLQNCENSKALSSTATYSSEASSGATGTGSSGNSLISPLTNVKPASLTARQSSAKSTTSTQKVVVEARVVAPPNNTVVKSATIEPAKQSQQNGGRILPSYYYGSPDEDKVTYCLMLGSNENRHVPALNPASFDPGIIKPNHLPGGGSNFYTYPTAGFIGDLGVTADKGIFFFSKELIDAFMIASDNGIVQLKAQATGWVPMDLVYNGDGYYTWSPR